MLEELGKLEFFINGFLHQGLAMLSADPKSGKSWLCQDICLSAAAGIQVLGRDTYQCDTLYLALEDGKRRLQDRLKKVMAAKGLNKPPNNFYLAIAANPIDLGLLDQLEQQLAALPYIKLIVIDVLNRVRATKGSFGKNAYEVDSAELAKIKSFADKHNLCILLIHHNRKSKDSQDPFQNISGSQGILGAVDESFMLTKESRMSNRATLNVISREMEDFDMTIEFDRETCVWQDVTGEVDLDADRAAYEANAVVRVIKALLDEAADKSWTGTATDLIKSGERLSMPIDLKAQAVGYEIRKLGKVLFDYDQIIYAYVENGTASKKHRFYYLPDYVMDRNDEAEDEDGDDDIES